MDPGVPSVEGVMATAPPAEVMAPASSTFEAFYRIENPVQVRRAALLLGGDEAAANDVVHDAFLALYQRWGTVADPGPYLNRSVLNACRDRARREHRWRDVVPRLAAGSGVAAGASGAGGDGDHEILWDVIATLPFNQRAVVVLRFYEGRTEAEIAAALSCKPGSVGPWLHRALTSMRKALR